MRKIKPLFFLIFLLTVFCCQQKNIDTKTILKVDTYHKKGIEFYQDSLLHYIKKSKKIIEKNNAIPDSLKAENDYLYGFYLNSIGNIDSSIHYLTKAVNYTKDSIARKREERYYEFLIERYIEKGDHLNTFGTLTDYEKLILKQKDNFLKQAYINSYKQEVCKDLKKYDSALFFNKKVIQLYKTVNDTVNLVNSLIFKANINYDHLNNKSLAKNLLDSLTTIDVGSNESGFIKNMIFYNYGKINLRERSFDKAYNNFVKAANYIKTSPYESDRIYLVQNYEKIAETLIELKKYDLAKRYADSSKMYKQYRDAELKNMALFNELKLSFYTHKEFKNVGVAFDSLSDFIIKNEEERINKDFIALKEANKNEKELLIKNQRSEIDKIKLRRNLIYLSSVFGLGIIIAVLFYRQKKLKFLKDHIFMQQRLFRSQMNPHFTSNTLINIQKLIKEDTNKANTYLLKFSRLLRLTLDNSLENYISVDNELEALTKYLELQQLRFPNTFEYKINTRGFDDLEFYKIPPMLIQPFVENAIKHGFKDIDHLGNINITLSLKDPFIECVIVDNGHGFDEKQLEKESSASIKLIKKIILKLSKEKIKINTSKNKGVQIVFNIPYQH